MDASELVRKFPEIPEVLHQEAVLEEFSQTFGDLLQTAWKPSNCGGSQQTAENVAYMKLGAPLTYLSMGLSTVENTVAGLRTQLDAHGKDPAGFIAELIPADVAQSPGGCAGD